MPKYYCQTGSFKQIIDAPDIDGAADDFVYRTLSKKIGLGFLILISEIRFSSSTYSLIPGVGTKLLPKHRLIELVAKVLKKRSNESRRKDKKGGC